MNTIGGFDSRIFGFGMPRLVMGMGARSPTAAAKMGNGKPVGWLPLYQLQQLLASRSRRSLLPAAVSYS